MRVLVGFFMIGPSGGRWQLRGTWIGQNWIQICTAYACLGKLKRTSFVHCASDQCPEVWRGLLPATYLGQYGPSPDCPYPQPGLIPTLLLLPECRLSNKPEGPRCTFNLCKYAHVCALCKGQHARAECRAKCELTSAAKRPRLSWKQRHTTAPKGQVYNGLQHM